MKNLSSDNGSVDKELIKLVLKGNKDALETLLSRHKDWIFNIALNMTGNTHDAEDITQEVLIKIVTKLNTFEHRSSFRTWIFRITKNHLLNMKLKTKEGLFSSFDEHKYLLDQLGNDEYDYKNSVERDLLINEVKVECMTGMMLCLSRDQRLIFIMGAVFGVDSKTSAELLEMSPESFRKKLSRARSELKQFMEGNCSLINSENKCKCSKKTSAAIKYGYVDPDSIQFNKDHYDQISSMVKSNDMSVNDVIVLRIQDIYREQPYKIFELKTFSGMMGLN